MSSKSATAAQRQLLIGPIVPTMLYLAIPTIILMVGQTLVGLIETYFVSRLGTEALAGVSMVFPILMLMQMISNGGFGAGVASAVARALGAGRRSDADAIVLNALVLGVALGLIFTFAEFFGGSALYYALGGRGETLFAAVSYAHTVFTGAVAIWIVSFLMAALRGSGQVVFPAVVTLSSLIVLVPLSMVLIFGWGPLPRLGVFGAAIAVVAVYMAAAAVLLWYMRSGRSMLTLRFDLKLIKWRFFKDILHVGALSAIATAQANLTVVLLTGIVGLFGANAIAGYGIASRLDYALLPLLFGLGTAVLTMVGTNIGAGQVARARQIAWTGAWIAAAMTEVIGIVAAWDPQMWVGLFSNDPVVLETGTLYLSTVAPFYGFYGLGMLLYFAGQGSGYVFWPVIASTFRLIVAVLAGWLIVVQLGGGLEALFIVVAMATVVFTVINIVAKLFDSWDSTKNSALDCRGSAAPVLSVAADDQSRS